MSNQNSQEFREDTKERLTRVEKDLKHLQSDVSRNHNEAQHSTKQVEDLVREALVELRNVSKDVNCLKTKVEVINVRLEEKEKHEKQKQTLWTVLIASGSAIIAAVIGAITGNVTSKP